MRIRRSIALEAQLFRSGDVGVVGLSFFALSRDDNLCWYRPML